MRVLYLLKKDPAESLQKIIDVQSKENEVKLIKLSDSLNYETLVEDVFEFDKVVCW